MTADAATHTAGSVNAARWRIAGAAALAMAAIALSKLALPALLVMIIATASLPALAGADRRFARIAIGVGFTAVTIASVRFVLVDALSGIVDAGKREAGKVAVSRLREILFAEDAARRHAYIDPDHDGIGSAALLDELTGAIPLRSGQPLTAPILEPRNAVRVISEPPALAMEGYLYRVCLPRAGGGWTASAGTPVDEELAERRFVAYAWPKSAAVGLSEAYFIDEHERILEYDNSRAAPSERYVGPPGPACDAALRAPAAWKVWMGKKPRTSLPGDSR